MRNTKREAIIGNGSPPRLNNVTGDSPDESPTGIDVRVFPALLQDRSEVLTAKVLHTPFDRELRIEAACLRDSEFCLDPIPLRGLGCC
jgi:hypothetical protein